MTKETFEEIKGKYYKWLDKLEDNFNSGISLYSDENEDLITEFNECKHQHSRAFLVNKVTSEEDSALGTLKQDCHLMYHAYAKEDRLKEIMKCLGQDEENSEKARKLEELFEKPSTLLERTIDCYWRLKDEPPS